MGLKTAKGAKKLKLDPTIFESIQKEKVSVGDVIYIEANSGAVKVSHDVYYVNYVVEIIICINLSVFSTYNISKLFGN